MIWRSRCRSHCANYCKRGICRRLAPTRKRSETRQGLSRIHVLQQVGQIDLVEGVIRSPLVKYSGYNLRICRPVGLTEQDRLATIKYVLDREGYRYDTRNILDLMRYLLPTPPVPSRYRRRLIAFGSGDPTRAICSTLSRRRAKKKA